MSESEAAMTDNSIERSYGNALFMLSEEEHTTERIKDDIAAVRKVISENPKYTSLLDSPALSREERCKLADDAFSGLNGNLVNLIKILAEKRLCHYLGKIFTVFMTEYDRTRGIERVEAVTAVPMTKGQIERLTAKLKAMTGKQIIVRNTQDKSLLGGIKLRYGGIQLDDTIKSKLDAFEKHLSEVVI